MNILILDGFPQESSSKLQALLLEAQADPGVEYISLAKTEIKHCQGCFSCWLITPGECVILDAGNDVARKYINSDAVILLTPVTFGGYSSVLKKALDRMIPNICGLFTKYQGETHHVRRYARYPALVILGVQETADREAAEIFQELAHRNSLNLYPTSMASHVFNEATETEQLRSDLMATLAQAGVRL
mgnify:CR=1 FL=1